VQELFQTLSIRALGGSGPQDLIAILRRAGTTFGIKPREIQDRIDARAHVLIKEMLQEPRLSAVIPGVNVPEQLEENVKGSYERDQPATPEEKAAFQQCLRNFYAHLTPDYGWLHKWHYV